MLAFVMLTRRCLRIHHGYHWRSLAELASKLLRTFAGIIINTVQTTSSVLAHMVLAIVNILCAIFTSISCRTFAAIIRKVVHALGSILAGIELGAAELDLGITELPSESGLATAGIRLNSIDARSIILTVMLQAVVYIYLTPSPRISWHALTTESSLLHHGARRVMSTGIPIASVNHEFAPFTVVTRCAKTLELPLRLWHAFGIVLAGECVTGVALREDLVADFAATNKGGGWRGKQKLVSHWLGFSATGDSRLHVVHLHPLGQPFQGAVTV